MLFEQKRGPEARERKKAFQIMFDCLRGFQSFDTTRRSLEEGQSMSGVDARDLRAFLHGRAGVFNNQPLDTEFVLNGEESKKRWMITLYQSNLTIDDQATPWGRLVVNVDDNGFLGKGLLTLDFRRLGNRYILIIRANKASFGFDQTFNETQLPIPIQSIPEKKDFGLLDRLGKYLGEDPANTHLVRGLESLLSVLA